MVDIHPIVSFLESLEFECHLNADNEHSFVVWQGQTIHGLSQEMALRNGLYNWLRNELGRNWRDIWKRYIDTSPFALPDYLKPVEQAIHYHDALEASMYGGKR